MKEDDMQDSAAAAEETAKASGDPNRRNWLRQLYVWVLHWAHTPYGTPALFGISFAESSFFPIPPDILQIALSISKAASFLLLCRGQCRGVGLGWNRGLVPGVCPLGIDQPSGFFMCQASRPERVRYVGELYRDNAFLTIFGAAFSPIPYKVFTVSAGLFHDYVPLQTLIAASILGRSLRFFSVATCIYFFGPRVRDFLEKYFERVTLALFVMVVLGFLAVCWF